MMSFSVAPSVQLRLERFTLPTLLDEMAAAPVSIDVSLLRGPSLDLPSISVLLLLSRSPLTEHHAGSLSMSPDIHVWRRFTLTPADTGVARRLEMVRVSGLQVGPGPLPDNSLCGPVWAAVLVDPEDAVTEPDEGWRLHVQQRPTAIVCQGGQCLYRGLKIVCNATWQLWSQIHVMSLQKSTVYFFLSKCQS